MYIKKDLDFEDLRDECWSGAVDTIETIEDKGKEDELMELLENYFDDTPTMTEVNDLLWFESEYIFNELGINEDDEDDDE